MQRLAVSLLMLSTLFLQACWIEHGKLDLMGYGKDFNDAYLRFTRLVRWGQWEKASEYVVPEARGEFMRVMKSLEDVEFTDWDPIMIDIGDAWLDAEVEVKIDGYQRSTLVERSARMSQQWTRKGNVIQGDWQVHPDVHDLFVAFTN